MWTSTTHRDIFLLMKYVRYVHEQRCRIRTSSSEDSSRTPDSRIRFPFLRSPLSSPHRFGEPRGKSSSDSCSARVRFLRHKSILSPLHGVGDDGGETSEASSSCAGCRGRRFKRTGLRARGRKGAIISFVLSGSTSSSSDQSWRTLTSPCGHSLPFASAFPS